MASFFQAFRCAPEGEVSDVPMTMTHRWYESFHAAVLETDWTNMLERVQAAEFEIQERQRVLSEDHGGTPEERQALANALKGLKVLRRDAASWLDMQKSSKARPHARL
jgi:hypothetical protein